MKEQPDQNPANIGGKELLNQNPEYVANRDQLKQKYEDVAWQSATNIISLCIGKGKMDEAKYQAREAIKNWEEEGKTEVILKFREWLKNKNIILDKE